MKREIIEINEELCDGCGLCAQGCHEGAIQMINGKAVLINDLLCDGLGACIGECPQGAIEITLREAEAYDEIKVMETLVPKGEDVVFAHLKHLQDYKEEKWLEMGRDYLVEHQNEIDYDVTSLLVRLEASAVFSEIKSDCSSGTCPGSEEKIHFANENDISTEEQVSALTHWPVQMHLINPQSSVFQDADLLLSADCVAHAVGNFHGRFLNGKKLAIACPKLDSNKESYIEKLQMMIEHSGLKSIHVLMMEVPCCHSLLSLVKEAQIKSKRIVPVRVSIVGTVGDILRDEQLH
ncbi:MAG: 4Fe-4S ferredoxin [Marinilabiliales bacterium]|nr:MAG: 4Fe-4S ferredoxin [Marinilabiliales bacterium]